MNESKTCRTCKHEELLSDNPVCKLCRVLNSDGTGVHWEPKEVKVNPPVAYTCARHGGGWGTKCPDCQTDAETFGALPGDDPEPTLRDGCCRSVPCERPGVGPCDLPAGNKPSNPKDLVGSGKAPLSALPMRVLWNLGLGMLEGQCKYGRHNYRAVGVRASIYFDASMRHILSWWEGEDNDPDSGLCHIDKAIVSLMVLRDSMLADNWTDDRPPIAPVDWDALNAKAKEIIEKHKDKSPKHYTRSGE